MGTTQIAKNIVEAYDGKAEVAIHETLLHYATARREGNQDSAKYFGAVAEAIAEL